MAERSRESIRRGVVPRRGRAVAVRARPGPTVRQRRAPLVATFFSRREWLPVVRSIVAHAAHNAGFAEEHAAELGAAAEAAAANVIDHAYGGAESGHVELWIDDRGGQLRVELRDSGATLDPRSLPRRRGGRGMQLMERVMDSVTYRRSARRNVCCLVKRKDPRAS